WDDESQRWAKILLIALLAAFFCCSLFAGLHTKSFQAAFAALLVGGSATAIGAAFGFLFGIPRTVQEPSTRPAEGFYVESAYHTNTNLEQISDWLTKIIVGATLIELQNLIPFFESISTFVSPAFGGKDSE